MESMTKAAKAVRLVASLMIQWFPPLVGGVGHARRRRLARAVLLVAAHVGRRVQGGLADQRPPAAHQRDGGGVVDVGALVQLAGRVHLLVQLKQEQGLEHPQLGGRAEVVVHEELPAQGVGQEVGQLGAGRDHLGLVRLVQAGGADDHHGDQEQVRHPVGGKGRLVQDGQLVAEVDPVRGDVGLHHLPAEHMVVVGAVALQDGLLLLLDGRVGLLAEALLDELEQLVAPLLGHCRLGEVLVEQALDRHDLLRAGGREVAHLRRLGPVVGDAVGIPEVAVAPASRVSVPCRPHHLSVGASEGCAGARWCPSNGILTGERRLAASSGPWEIPRPGAS